MTAAWMVYGTIVGLLVAGAARAADSLVRLAGRPARWIWVGALVVTPLFVLVAPYRTTSVARAVAIVDGSVPLREPLVAESSSWSARLRATVAGVQRALSDPLETVIGGVPRKVPATADAYLAFFWIGGSAVLMLLFAGVHLRFRRARRRWPSADVHGVRVRVAPSAGPAVIGLAPPEIVVPRWLLGRGREEQRLVIAHEVEHLRAGDPWILAIGCMTVALLPWNLAAWWMLGRLRLAVELDCDARVLAGNVAPRSYGELLIDLAEHCSGLRIGAPALADDSSHLYQRLMAMQRPIARFALARGAAAGVLALGALLVACEAKMPTDADVSTMDVASAERAATTAMLKRDEPARYLIDGVAATPEQAHALRVDQIAAIEINKAVDKELAEMRIRTMGVLDTLTVTTRLGERLVTLGRALPADNVKPERREPKIVADREKLIGHAVATLSDSAVVHGTSVRGAFTGIVFINGVRADLKALESLDRSSILSVEVIKGNAATSRYSDPAAANGVINVVSRAR